MVLVKPGRKRKIQHEENKTGNNKEKLPLYPVSCIFPVSVPVSRKRGEV